MEAYYTSLANKAHTLLLGCWLLCKAWSLSFESPTVPCLARGLRDHMAVTGAAVCLYVCLDVAAAELFQGLPTATFGFSSCMLAGFVQDRAMMAETLHRANLLCLLANGLLLDQAADEPLVQASTHCCAHITCEAPRPALQLLAEASFEAWRACTQWCGSRSSAGRADWAKAW